MQFKPGDVVVLKSGGPPMTIESIEKNSAHCYWFVDASPKWHSFGLVMLEMAPK